MSEEQHTNPERLHEIVVRDEHIDCLKAQLSASQAEAAHLREQLEQAIKAPAPSASAPVEVTKEMVERAIHELDFTAPESREHMRRALTAALKGKP